MKQTRREFIKLAIPLGCLAFIGIKGVDAFASQSKLEQKVVINLPAYSLTLMNFIDGELKESYTFTVGVGRGSAGKKQTPIGSGIIYEKRDKVIFRYGKSYPNLKIKRGDVIRWTNTFDELGNPVGYRMPTKIMKGLGMMITSGPYNYNYNDFVIHSTTDKFTVGTPVSDGCIRAGIEDMLRLYDLIEPENKEGALERPVPVDIKYNVIELNQDELVLHANIYHKSIDYIAELKKQIAGAGVDENCFDYNKAGEAFLAANSELDKVYKQVLEILSRSHPRNFVSPSLKEQLHKTFNLSEFLND